MQKSFICLFASIWTHIIGPIFPSNFSSGISDFSLKIEYLKNPFFATFLIEKWPIGACSAAGSALHSHCRGRRFESDQVHQNGNRRGFYHGDFSFDHRNTTDGFLFWPLEGHLLFGRSALSCLLSRKIWGDIFAFYVCGTRLSSPMSSARISS